MANYNGRAMDAALDILAYAVGTFYFVVIIGFLLAVVISGFGGWHR